jgi:pimeloyl-ACP methyl ester carboxylesterase
MLLAALLASLAVVPPPIRWEPFELPAGTELRAELGRLTVPLDRAKPGAGSAELAFVRLRAGEGSLRAPIVYLAGGPGGSGVNVARNEYALPSLARLARVGDVILLDQRGVGMSTPRPFCRPETAADKRFVPPAEAMPRLLAATRACVAEWAAKGAGAGAFNNRESAADLDDLRRALGVPKVSLLGHSYGTFLALLAIRNHGDAIERAALISTAGPNHMRKMPLVLDTQLAKLSILAGVDMTAQLRRILAKLEREPMPVTITDRGRKEEVTVPIDADALRRILVLDIGDGNDFTVFPALLQTIEEGDPSILAWFAEKRYNQQGTVDLMYLGMRCSGGATASRDRDIALEARRSIFGDAQNGYFPGICAGLPPMDGGDAARGPLVSNVPVLFVSGTLDSNTPPYQAEELRWGMPRAQHLVVPHAGHEDLEPNDEVQQAIADFLAGQDVSDRRIALPPPRFRSVEEAKKERSRP